MSVNMELISNIMLFLGGLGLFIYGMKIMSVGFQKTAGNKMKRLLEMLTKTKFTGILVGALVTAVIQSSSATTVMVVGFVNTGLMNLTQSAGIIMGANIGTTFTAWLVASVEWLEYFNPVFLAPVAVFVGAVMALVAKYDRARNIGEIIIGFGILFVGMSTMSGSIAVYRVSPFFRDIFLLLGSNPFLGVMAGAFVTGIIQSSSASVAILQSLAISGIIPWSASVYIIMGQNIGTCVTAILSAAGASRNARAAAYLHLLFNVAGTVVFGTLCVIYFHFLNKDLATMLITATQISLFHSGFNFANTLLLYRFSDTLIYLAKKLARVDDNKENDETALAHLDERILETPRFAVENCVKEIVRLSKIARENFRVASESIFDRDEEKINSVLKRERNIDTLTQAITLYLVKLCNTNISKSDYDIITPMFHAVNDIERIGDHSENLAEEAQFAVENEVVISAAAEKELNDLIELTEKCYSLSIEALESDRTDHAEYLEKVKDIEDKINAMEKRLKASHTERLATGECKPTAGVFFLDVLTNLERIGDYALNIAQSAVFGVNRRKRGRLP